MSGCGAGPRTGPGIGSSMRHRQRRRRREGRADLPGRLELSESAPARGWRPGKGDPAPGGVEDLAVEGEGARAVPGRSDQQDPSRCRWLWATRCRSWSHPARPATTLRSYRCWTRCASAPSDLRHHRERVAAPEQRKQRLLLAGPQTAEVEGLERGPPHPPALSPAPNHAARLPPRGAALVACIGRPKASAVSSPSTTRPSSRRHVRGCVRTGGRVRPLTTHHPA
jgi:hypothetical protein